VARWQYPPHIGGESAAPQSNARLAFREAGVFPSLAPREALSGDNGSAFFSRLHSRAKSAMAEILVSDLCECRPPLLIGGLFHSHPGITRMPNRRIPLSGDSRAAPSPAFRRPARRKHSPGFPTVPIVLRIVFFRCSPLFSRRWSFWSLRKALHC